MNNRLFIRRAQLFVTNVAGDELDLSDLRFRFRVEQSDIETPNNATIRIYNLSKPTVKALTATGNLEFNKVVLNVGYEDSVQFGTIFDGTIKQFRVGRENNIDSYFDILAADLDLGYNFGIVSKTLPAEQNTARNRIEAAAAGMQAKLGYIDVFGGTIPAPRSKVMYGLSRYLAREEAVTQKSSWSVQDGKLQFIPLTGYKPGEVVQLNVGSGLIGIPEQTDEGIRARCLLNPRFDCGTLIEINNALINATFAQNKFALPLGQFQYNSWTGMNFPASVAADGKYRLFACDHVGDTRGTEWYSELTALALDTSVANQAGPVPAYG